MHVHRLFFIVSALTGLLIANLRAADSKDVPVADKKPSFNEYHGTKVEDDYQWLENDDDAAVKAWSDAENKLTRAYLDGLPTHSDVEKQLTEWYAKTSPSYSSIVARPGLLFAMKFQPPKQQPMLVTLASADDLKSEKVLVDPNKIDSKGTTAIDWFEPSLDGSKVAVSLSKGGSEDGTLHFFDAGTGKELGDTIAHVQYPTAGGSAAWNGDGSGVYYTRFPRKGERAEEDLNFYQQIYFHKLGTPDSDDTYATGKDFPRIAEIKLESSSDGKNVLATVANGDGGDFAHYLLGPDGTWKQITQFSDQVKLARVGRDHALYLLSRADAPRGKVLRLSLDTPELSKAVEIVPETDAVVQAIEPTANALYLADLLGGPSQLRRFDLAGTNGTTISVPAISSVPEMAACEDGSLLFRDISYTEPAAWFKLSAGENKPVKSALVSTSPVSLSDIEVTREFAPSKDGTKIPLNILCRKGTKLDGSNPTLLYGYGGYGVSMTPAFDFQKRLWFDRGGVYVVANIRGGGEFGEDWHQAGKGPHKQNVFDDFYAAAQALVQQRYTTANRLGIMGGSNGGLLVGAALTQHPEAFRAVVGSVGVYDSLRHEQFPNGKFNVTEYGSTANEGEFKTLYSYSAYHNVKKGTAYPAVFMTTGVNDPRVAPWQSRKFAAALQAATSSNRPILLVTRTGAGHGIGAPFSQRVGNTALALTFFNHELRSQ